MSGSERPSFSGALAVGRKLDLPLPDSPAVRDAYAHAEAESQPWLFNHVMRMARRAEGWSGLHFVGPRHGKGSTLHGQCRGDHLPRDTGRTLSVAHVSDRKGDGRPKDN